MNGQDIRVHGAGPYALGLSHVRMTVADEMDALDAWRDAVCAAIWTRVPTMDEGGYGCDGEHDGNHDERCPVAIARKAFFEATDRRRAMIPGVKP